MTRTILLDAGPIGYLVDPRRKKVDDNQCVHWLSSIMRAAPA